METFSHPDSVGRYGEENYEVSEAFLRRISIGFGFSDRIYRSGFCLFSSFN